MIKRIKSLMQEFSMSENEFAKALSMSQSTLNGYTKESRKPSLALAESVLNAFENVSAEWLLRGEGKMYKTTELPPVDVSSEESINHSAEIARLVREKNELIEKIEDLQAKCAKLEELTDELSKENIAIAAQRDMAKDLLREYVRGDVTQKVG
jgi:transcriptional regulator with XRE-family HTH domain